jgi:PAS domain S-box-containing protein
MCPCYNPFRQFSWEPENTQLKAAIYSRYNFAMNEPLTVFPDDPTLPQPARNPDGINGEPALDKIVFRYLLQPIGHFQFISSGISALTGHAQSEFYKSPNIWVQCLHPDDQAEQTRVLLGQKDGKRKRLRVHKPGHGYIWLEQSVTVSCDDEGRPLAVEAECQILDEDHIKRMSGDLSNPGIIHLLDLAPLPISISSIEDKQILFANQAMVEFLKFPLSDLLELKSGELPVWFSVEERDKTVKFIRSHNTDEHLPVTYRAGDGSIKRGLLSTQIVPFQSKTCFMNIIVDVTEQEEQKTRLQSDYESLSRLIEHSPLSINVADANGKTVLWNRRSEQLFGWTAEEMLGQTMPFIREYGEEAFHQFWDTIRDQKIRSGLDVRLKCKDGFDINLCMYNSPVYDSQGVMTGVLGILADSTEEGKAHLMQRALFSIANATNETRNLDELYKSIHLTLSTLMPAENIFIALYDETQGIISYPYYQDQFDQPPEPSKREHGLTAYVIRTGDAQLVDPARFEELIASGEVESVGSASIDWLGVPLKIKNRTFGMIAVQSYTEGIRFTEEHKNLLEFVSDQIAMAVERVRNEETIRISEKRYRDIIEDQTDLICRFRQDGSLTFTNQAFCDFFSIEREDVPGSSIFSILPQARFKRKSKRAPRADDRLPAESFDQEHVRKDGSLHWLQWKTRTIFSETGELVEIQSVGRDITEQQLRHREMELIARITSTTRFTHSTPEMLDEVLDKISDMIKVDALGFSLYGAKGEGMTLDYVRGIWKDCNHTAIPISHAVIGELFRTRGIYLNNRVNLPSATQPQNDLTRDLTGVAGIPLVSEDTPIGMLWLGKKSIITNEEVRLIQSVGNITANGLHRINLFEKTQERLRRLTTLKTIDLAITSTVELKVILDILIDQIVNQLNVDAASIWLYDPVTQMLEYSAGRGFHSSHFKNYRLRLGESHAGRVALERKREIVQNLDEINDTMTDFYKKLGEQFASFIAIPLIAKGQVKGVLEIFTKRRLTGDTEWLEFMDSLGGQAAIALDNATMFERLQRSNIELSMAYDATIDGWARALEMRDQETIGHTRRVADLTIGLVKILNDERLDIEQVRRGVMLHDIGKMGIPDRILLKKGKLTPDEWKIMRMHPAYAYDMLHSVPNLRKLVDIPYCHHEKWDGSGYPRGLKEEEIPLSARIFTIVDVWDAIRSDRPYRPAWPEKRAIDYVRMGSDKQFDPQLAKLFLDNLANLVKPETGYPTI